MLKKFLMVCGSIFKKPSTSSSAANSKNYPNLQDTARSVSQGNVVEIIASAGKYGLELFRGSQMQDIASRIFLSETPMYRDGQYFFKGVTVGYTQGFVNNGLDDFYFDGLCSEKAVGAEIKNNLPITRSFVSNSVTVIRCRFAFTLLKNRRENNQIVQVIGNECTIQVSIKEKNTGFIVKPLISISGKYSSPYEVMYEWTVNNTQNNDEFFIKVERITGADGIDDTRYVTWQSYTQVVKQSVNFKKLVAVGIRFDADEFGTDFPDRQYRIGGMLLDIPTNGFYSGVDGIPNYNVGWNGQLKPFLDVACEDFGAIIWYLLLDEVDGLGTEVKEYMVDRYSLFSISFYNSANIFRNEGRFERRWKCNLVINKSDDGWKVIDSLLSGCFARRYWEGGILKFTQDRPDTIYALITNADIIDDFNYSSTDIDERATAVNVTWTDINNFSKTRTEYVQDPLLISHQGYTLKEIEAVGANTREQAARYGRAIIYSENYESGIVTFKGRQHLAYIPIGKVVAVCDSTAERARLGGIVKGLSSTYATNDTIELDYPVTIKPYQGFDETFYCTLYLDIKSALENGDISSAINHYLQYGKGEGRSANGYLVFIQGNNGLQVGRVLNSPGSYSTLTVKYEGGWVSPTFLNNANWVLFSPENKHKLYRVLSKEIDEENLDLITMTCTEYSEFKWQRIERNLEIGNYRNLPQTDAFITPDVTNFGFSSKTTVANNKVQITLSWTRPINTELSRYIISYSAGLSPISNSTIWTETSVIYTQSLNVFSFTLDPNSYSFKIVAVNYNGELSRGQFINPAFYGL